MRFREYFVYVTLVINVLTFIFLISMLLATFKTNYVPLDVPLNNNETTNLTDCVNLSLEDSVYCLNDHFREIFSYNITTDYNYTNFTMIDRYIRQYGGDCHESAVWFSKAGSELGFDSKYISFTLGYENNTNDNEPNIRILHALAVIANRQGYCIIDQGLAGCNYFKKKVNISIE